MEIFTAIRKDHEKQRLLMKILVETTGNSESRQKYFTELKAELAHHAIAEERHFYSPLMESDNTIEPSRHAIAEHHEIDELVEKLENTDMSSSAWLIHMKSLQELVLHHLDEEEHEFFQQAGKVLTAAQKQKLADEYRHEMEIQES
ncbi:hemerythrin domain-containing protein [Aliiglaciecola sp. LCG003]|uniref:hemerythrin domain-containing protein n=1 Tax=Aliiglaciecola sp. LCG003 TaxID=3053655 RepID=UPI00257379E2|nr:hemerythrin domain-containing protein [Aliiglaciecola sp. LCG003]WJG09646.1 hemerythrin domain-containing protein [Aliiglaciecola sp. LCG003]